jgi:hypothetical protein
VGIISHEHQQIIFSNYCQDEEEEEEQEEFNLAFSHRQTR